MDDKKIFFKAGIGGLSFIILPLIFMTLGIFFLNDLFSILSTLSFFTGLFLFNYGFYFLGVRYKNSLLKFVGVFSLMLAITSFIFLTASSGYLVSDLEGVNQTLVYKSEIETRLVSENLTETEYILLKEELNDFSFFWNYRSLQIMSFFVVLIFISLALFNFSLAINKKIKFSKATGIIGLIIQILFLSVYGIALLFPLSLAYYVLLILILFNESKIDLEKKVKKKNKKKFKKGKHIKKKPLENHR